MNDDQDHFSDIFKEYLPTTLESGIYLSDDQQIHLDKCLSHLYRIYHIALVLHCTLVSLSSIYNSTNIGRESVRPLRKFYWTCHIKQVYLSLCLSALNTSLVV